MSAAKQILYLLLAFGIILFFGWQLMHPQKIRTALKLQSNIDATVTKLSLRQFDAQGHLIHLFTSPLMQHLPTSDAYIFQDPNVLITQKDKAAWEIRARHARAFHEASRIVFTKEVVVHQNKDQNNPESTLKTEKIIYYPKEKKATTDKLVTFEQAGNFIQSIGMNAYLDEKKVELLHQARGRYVQAKA